MFHVKIYTKEEISKKRREVTDQVKKFLKPNFTSFTGTDLRKIYELYDRVFFDGQIARKIKQTNSTLTFEATRRGGSGYAGKCIKKRGKKICHYILRFPIPLFTKLFTGKEKTLRTNGLICRSRLGCLLLTFEHELMHLIQSLWGFIKKGPIFSGHGKLFQCMVKSYFGHTEYKHKLLWGDPISSLSMSDMRIGMKVRVRVKSKDVYGIVEAIHKKTVYVVYDQKGEIGLIRSPPSFLEPTTKDIKLPEYLKKKDARVGMKVKFKYKGREVTGKLVKINPANAIVFFDGEKFSVMWGSLTKA